jgi:hypothetical protein
MAIPCLRHTKDTEFERIAPGGFRILSALDHATQVIGRDLWITAGTNDHTTGRHPLGEAFDVRTKDLPGQTIVRLVQVLRATLGARFAVLYETPIAPKDPALLAIATVNPKASGEHVHVQVRKNTDYPPTGEDVVKV